MRKGSINMTQTVNYERVKPESAHTHTHVDTAGLF